MAERQDATRRDEMTCGHKPRPWSGAYGHWACERERFHLGRHRARNYTWRRGARLWGGVRYLARLAKLRLTNAPPWRGAVRHTATKYDPVEVRRG